MIEIPEFLTIDEQYVEIGNATWSVARLITLSRNLKVMTIPLEHLNIDISYEKLSGIDLVMHMRAIIKADLSFPIILGEDGNILDGRHRIMKSLWKNKKTIKAVRFDSNPEPCSRRY